MASNSDSEDEDLKLAIALSLQYQAGDEATSDLANSNDNVPSKDDTSKATLTNLINLNSN
jgi:hypothetical protein